MLRAITAIVLGAYLLGFVIFVSSFPKAQEYPKNIQGVVALTGGQMRLDTAYRLFCYENVGSRMLISGVYPENSREKMLNRLKGVDAGYKAEQQTDCQRRQSAINLGYAAENTRGNAREAAAWARFYRLHSILIVTARYHMPRAQAEFREAMPWAKIVPYPIDPESLPKDWWCDFHAIRLLHGEYAKYLASSVLTALGLEPKDLDGAEA